jgi:enterochelin esterase family protein
MAGLARVFAGICAATVSLTAQQAHVNLDWAPHKNTQGLKPYGAGLISPDVGDDGSITFRVKAPEAQRVELTGGPLLLALGRTGKNVPFTKGEDGIWTVSVGPVKPNLYVYKFVIDGATVADPNNTLTGFADQPAYSTVVVHGSAPAYYDARNLPHGVVARHVYRSEVTNGERELYVYTPPGYDRRKKYPVLYLLGGSGELASTWNIDGRAGFILDNLLAEGKAVPMLIAMPNNQVIHRSDPQHTDKTFDLFEAELKKHILPLVEKSYGVQANRRGRALAGLSMGGRHAQLVGFRNRDLFGSFGILSAGLAEGVVDPKADYLFVGLGTHENTPQNRSVLFHQALEKQGIAHDYYVGGEGGHDWGTWRDHLRYMLPKLFR